mgnify:CR=1 FL=1
MSLKERPGDAEDRVPRGGSDVFSPSVFKRHLERHGLSLEDIAAEIGVSRQAVSQWLAGATTPSPKSLIKAAEALSLSPADLTPNTDSYQHLADLRVRVGLTQAQAAGQASIPPSSLSALERGLGRPDPQLLVRLAELYRVDLNEVEDAWGRTASAKDRARKSRMPTRRSK